MFYDYDSGYVNLGKVVSNTPALIADQSKSSLFVAVFRPDEGSYFIDSATSSGLKIILRAINSGENSQFCIYGGAAGGDTQGDMKFDASFEYGDTQVWSLLLYKDELNDQILNIKTYATNGAQVAATQTAVTDEIFVAEILRGKGNFSEIIHYEGKFSPSDIASIHAELIEKWTPVPKISEFNEKGWNESGGTITWADNLDLSGDKRFTGEDGNLEGQWDLNDVAYLPNQVGHTILGNVSCDNRPMITLDPSKSGLLVMVFKPTESSARLCSNDDSKHNRIIFQRDQNGDDKIGLWGGWAETAWDDNSFDVPKNLTINDQMNVWSLRHVKESGAEATFSGFINDLGSQYDFTQAVDDRKFYIDVLAGESGYGGEVTFAELVYYEGEYSDGEVEVIHDQLLEKWSPS